MIRSGTVLTMKQGKSDNNITDRFGLFLQWQHHLKVLSGKAPPEQNVGFIVAEQSDRTQTKSMRSRLFSGIILPYENVSACRGARMVRPLPT
ncbi:MAG: hypothetical protein RIM23_13375 [Coleofasciculus sp. G3-WIS-01]|uniref:hypothetical protein n=1 Tax=Coleofasciculus sp. G3-WIS-01 TaxID=3069528 RepID=UPI0032F4CCD7